MRSAARHIRNDQPRARRTAVAAPRRRGGFLSMELVLVLPILGIVLMALFEFSILFFARTAVVEASRAGARAATLPLANAESVEQEVRRVLSPPLQRGLQVNVSPGSRSGDVVLVAVSVPMRTAAPDLLWPIGYSLQGRQLYSETSMLTD